MTFRSILVRPDVKNSLEQPAIEFGLANTASYIRLMIPLFLYAFIESATAEMFIDGSHPLHLAWH
jgi:hypothetical protein